MRWLSRPKKIAVMNSERGIGVHDGQGNEISLDEALKKTNLPKK